MGYKVSKMGREEEKQRTNEKIQSEWLQLAVASYTSSDGMGHYGVSEEHTGDPMCDYVCAWCKRPS